jgi:two-component system, OmpR family, sensor kinase
VTLRLRLYLAAGILMVVVAVLGLLLVRFVQASEIQQIDAQLRTALPVVGSLNHPPDSRRLPFPSPSRLPDANSRISAFYVATVADGHRDVLFTPLNGSGQSPRTPGMASDAGTKSISISTVGSLSGSQRWRAVLISSPLVHRDLLVAASLAGVDAAANRLRLAALAAGMIVLGVLLAAGFWVAKLGLRPIAEVTEAADAIAAGDRTRRVAGPKGETEAAHLARAFNLMLDEQQSLESRLRQFVADASHELRTPVAVILGITDLWRQGELASGEARDDAMRRIGQSGAQMGGLVEDLLLLARLDEGRLLNREPVDLASLIREIVLDASATNPSRSMEVEVADHVTVEGDEGSLRQMIANLVANALNHTPPTSKISIRAANLPNEALVEVVDTGPGMDPANASKAFDRFWRDETSRARPGTGLGLPIVAGIVAAHGGEITLTTDPASGTDVCIVLPLTQAA